MAMLTFLPWLSLNEPVRLPDFHLLQYKRRLLPIGHRKPLQKTLDQLLLPYRHLDKPVDSASILQLGNRGITDELTDLDRENVFTFSELIAFSGLSQREYFGIGMFYCNADNFICIVQSFEEDGGGVAVTTRRRDGQTVGYISAASYRIEQPLHVRQNLMRTKLDIPLLKSLIAARNSDRWGELFDSIFWFNRANTDSDGIQPEVEAVKIISSFERSLGLTHGKEKDLRKAFVLNFTPTQDVPYVTTERSKTSTMHGCTTVREAWIADFFRLRNAHAHGHRKAPRKFAWDLREHLLLSSYAFPLLMKSILAKQRLYTFTSKDQSQVDCFERLAAASLFQEVSTPWGTKDWPWNQIQTS